MQNSLPTLDYHASCQLGFPPPVSTLCPSFPPCYRHHCLKPDPGHVTPMLQTLLWSPMSWFELVCMTESPPLSRSCHLPFHLFHHTNCFGSPKRVSGPLHLPFPLIDAVPSDVSPPIFWQPPIQPSRLISRITIPDLQGSWVLPPQCTDRVWSGTNSSMSGNL